MIKAWYFLRRFFINNLIIVFLAIVIANRVIGETATSIFFVIIWKIDGSRILLFLTISKQVVVGVH
jgi:hypothetical protein